MVTNGTNAPHLRACVFLARDDCAGIARGEVRARYRKPRGVDMRQDKNSDLSHPRPRRRVDLSESEVQRCVRDRDGRSVVARLADQREAERSREI